MVLMELGNNARSCKNTIIPLPTFAKDANKEEQHEKVQF
jgi:hypothetical protein